MEIFINCCFHNQMIYRFMQQSDLQNLQIYEIKKKEPLLTTHVTFLIYDEISLTVPLTGVILLNLFSEPSCFSVRDPYYADSADGE